MPQAIERLLATPMIRPRLARMKAPASVMLPSFSPEAPAASYGIGSVVLQACRGRAREHGIVGSRQCLFVRRSSQKSQATGASRVRRSAVALIDEWPVYPFKVFVGYRRTMGEGAAIGRRRPRQEGSWRVSGEGSRGRC